MPEENTITRRGLLMKAGILFNGVVALALAVPMVRYVLSSVTRGRGNAYLSWVPLGAVSDFPEGETRLATFRNPFLTPTDGKTVDTACWVRRVAGEQFQVFAINCAHLGCPVRWFPQSGLFMCPCHGGAYYRDGTRASGPPERGLFEYAYKVEKGTVIIQAGELPTPGASTATLRENGGSLNGNEKELVTIQASLVPRSNGCASSSSSSLSATSTGCAELLGKKPPCA